MQKSELQTMLVSELKALALKKKIHLPAGAKKAAIIDVLLASGVQKQTSRKAPAAKKPPARRKVAAKAVKTSSAKKVPVRVKKAAPHQRKRPVRQSEGSITPVREWRRPPVAEEPFMVQERVSRAKYYTGPEMNAMEGAGDLPRAYGEDRIVLMTRDPFVAYAYWETSPARIERERAWFGWDSRLCVRIYDITGVAFDGHNASGYYDQEITEQVGNWYFNLGRPSHSFCADLGLLTPEGRFLTLSRSNYITMPRDGVSDVVDEEWMVVDEEFWRLYGGPSGLSSPEMHEMLRRRRMLEITSPGLFSGDLAKARRK